VLAVPALTKDGRQISLELTIVLLDDASRKTASMAEILRDVTVRFEEFRRLKRQLAERVRSGAARTGRGAQRVLVARSVRM
jgi:hypothetical protein